MVTLIVEIPQDSRPCSRMAKAAIVLRKGIRFDRSGESRSMALRGTVVHCIA
jgi:hypothetical protein